MNDENDKKAPESAEALPRKLLLGKRVLRHFNVRTSIQTGAMTSTDDNSADPQTDSIRQRCRPPSG